MNEYFFLCKGHSLNFLYASAYLEDIKEQKEYLENIYRFDFFHIYKYAMVE